MKKSKPIAFKLTTTAIVTIIVVIIVVGYTNFKKSLDFIITDTKLELVNKPEQYLIPTAMFIEANNHLDPSDQLNRYSYSFPKTSEYAGCKLYLEKKSDEYAIFTIGCADGNQYLAIINAQKSWQVITGMGQERPYCNDMEIYNIPSDWYESCIITGDDGYGTTISGKLSLPPLEYEE